MLPKPMFHNDQKIHLSPCSVWWHIGRVAVLCIGILWTGCALAIAQNEVKQDPTKYGEKTKIAELGRSIIAALRSGQVEHLKPFLGTVDLYIQFQSSSMPLDKVKETGAAWAKEQSKLAASSLRTVREFGTQQGIDWSKAEIRQIPQSARFEVQSHGRVICVIVPIIGIGAYPSEQYMLRFDEPWLTPFLSADELTRLVRWRPGKDKEEDTAVGNILIHKSVQESLLRHIRLYDPRQYYNTECKSMGLTVRLPSSLDPNRADTIECEELSLTLIETGNDSLVFQARENNKALFIPPALTLIDRDIRDCKSFSAIVGGQLQTFSRVKGAKRTFHTPSIIVRMIGKQHDLVSLTLQDNVVVGVRRGLPVPLSPNEFEQLCRWKPGVKREEDLAIGKILVRHSVTETMLHRLGTFTESKRERINTNVTIRVPAFFDKNAPDKIQLLDLETDFIETEDDSLEFHGKSGGLPPHKIVFNDRNIAKRKSWSAMVDGKPQTFSQIDKKVPQIFHAPRVELCTLTFGKDSSDGASQKINHSITLTLNDGVIVDFNIGKAVQGKTVHPVLQQEKGDKSQSK